MLRIAKSLLTVSLLTLPVFAYADLNINNASNASATALTDTSPCSSVVGDQGIMKPHSTLVVPKFVVDLYCLIGCDAHVFMSNNCSSRKIATVHVVAAKGVTEVKNYNVDGYVVTASGNNVTISGGPAESWFERIFGKKA